VRLSSWHAYLAAACLIFGLALIQAFPQRTPAVTNVKNETLVRTVKELETDIQSLEGELSSLRAEIDLLQKQDSGGRDLAKSLKIDLQTQQVNAGLMEMTGAGIVISLDDNSAGAQAAKKDNPQDYRPNDYIIHDKNLLYLVNELRAAGAKAVAVNDERIVLSSDIRCVGTVIMINSTRKAPPFKISALGNPSRLKKAVENGREYKYLKENNYPIKVNTADKLSVPAYGGTLPTGSMTPET